MIIPSPGHKIVISDLGQIELRILAMIADDTNMIRAFSSGLDLHAYTACLMFGIPLDKFDKKIKEHDDKRTAAKTINFAIVYQSRAESLAESLGIHVDSARDFMNKFFRAYPKVQQWIDYIKAFARANGYVETIYGRRRYLPNIKSSDQFVREGAERQSVNSPVQGSSGDVCFIGMIRFQEWLDANNKKTKIIGTVHDSILTEAPDEEVEEIAVMLPKIMTTDIPRITIDIKADVDILQKWKK
jgi:DNA polymerase-1